MSAPLEHDGRDPLDALARLFDVAMRDTGQSMRVRRFLLGWHNASVWGGFDLSDLWSLDDALVADVECVIGTLLRVRGKYPGDWLPEHMAQLLRRCPPIARKRKARAS